MAVSCRRHSFHLHVPRESLLACGSGVRDGGVSSARRRVPSGLCLARVHRVHFLVNVEEERDDEHDGGDDERYPAKQRVDGPDGRRRLRVQLRVEARHAEGGGHEDACPGGRQLAGQVVHRGDHAVDAPAALPFHEVGDVVAVGVEHDERDRDADGERDGVQINGTGGIGRAC